MFLFCFFSAGSSRTTLPEDACVVIDAVDVKSQFRRRPRFFASWCSLIKICMIFLKRNTERIRSVKPNTALPERRHLRLSGRKKDVSAFLKYKTVKGNGTSQPDARHVSNPPLNQSEAWRGGAQFQVHLPHLSEQLEHFSVEMRQHRRLHSVAVAECADGEVLRVTADAVMETTQCFARVP